MRRRRPGPAPGARSEGPRAAGSLLAPPWRWTTVSSTCSVGVVAFDELGVATALPRIAGDLDGAATYGWAVSALVLATVIGTAVGGQVADRRGPAMPSAVGFAVFALGVAVSGAAASWVAFLAGRFLQGLGAGAVVGMAYVIVTLRFPVDLRPRGLAALSAAYTLPALVGPVLAGLLTESVGWRAVFGTVLVAAGVAAGVSVPVNRGLARTPPAGTGRGPVGAVATVVWACALATALGLLLAGLGPGGWLPRVLMGGAGALVAGVALVRLTPAGTLRARRGLPAGFAARAMLCAGFFGADTFLALMLVEIRGVGATAAGIALAVGALAWVAGAGLQARRERRSGRGRRGSQAVVGCAALVLGMAEAGTVVLATSWPVPVAVLGWATAGTGMGYAYNATTAATFDLSTAADHGTTSSALQIAQTVGITVTAGVGTALLAATPQQPARGFALLVALAVACAAAALPLGRRVTDPA